MLEVNVRPPKSFLTHRNSESVQTVCRPRFARTLTDESHASLGELLAFIHSNISKKSVAPRRLMRAVLSQTLFRIRSENQLVEHSHNSVLLCRLVGRESPQRSSDARPAGGADVVCLRAQYCLSSSAPCATICASKTCSQVEIFLSKACFSIGNLHSNTWDSDEDGESSSGYERDYYDERLSDDKRASRTDLRAALMRKSPGSKAQNPYGSHHTVEFRSEDFWRSG